MHLQAAVFQQFERLDLARFNLRGFERMDVADGRCVDETQQTFIAAGRRIIVIVIVVVPILRAYVHRRGCR